MKSNEGQELILLLIIFLILFRLLSKDPIYSTNGHIDGNKVNNYYYRAYIDQYGNFSLM